jgi:hypothetical protein
MKVTVQVVLHADDDTQTVVREVFTSTAGGPVPQWRRRRICDVTARR